MKITTLKKWFKKGIVSLLLATVVLNGSAVLVNQFTSESPIHATAYADEAADAAAKAKAEAKAKSDAAAQTKTTATTSQVDKSLRNSVAFMISLQKVMNKLLWPILVMIGGLLDNSILFGSGMEERLREIWIPIRNLVNILFVIALVGIALYNVLGIGDESGNYSIKSILPKIIVGIVAVNFSFLGIKVFLDAINVLTVSIFALPNQVDEGLAKLVDSTDPRDEEKIQRFCKAMRGKSVGDKITTQNLQAEAETAIYRLVAQKYEKTLNPKAEGFEPIKRQDNSAAMKTKVYDKLTPAQKAQFDRELQVKKDGQICEGLSLTPQGKIFLKRYNSRNAALAMALNMSNILFYEDIPLDVNNIEKFAINTIFSLMLYIIYVASFIALFIVLLARLVVMWVAIALSPILLLGIAVPVVREKISAFGTITEQFMKNALAPVGIAISMTIGWIMLSALQAVNQFDSDSSIYFNAANGIPVVGLTTLQDLIVALGTVAVIWLAVFTAASETIAAPATDWLKGAVQKAGTWLGTTPLRHAPLFPIEIGGKSEKYTGAEMLRGVEALTNRTGKDNKLADKILNINSDNGVTGLASGKIKPKDAPEFLKYLNTNSDRLNLGRGDASTVKKYDDAIRRNPGLWKKIERSHSDFAKNLNTAISGINSKDPKVRGDAKKAASRAATLLARTPANDNSKSAAAAGAAAGTTAAKAAINSETKWGGKALGSDAEGATKVNLLNGKLNELAGATNAEGVKSVFTAMAGSSLKLPASAAELKAANPEAYANAETQLKAEGGVQKLLTDMNTPTPPAAS